MRNFNVFDETAEKKKYIFRLQSKTSLLASLGNELCLDDPVDKKASALPAIVIGGGSQTHDNSHPSLTDILFKTKNLNDMKRLFGLLQWKNSFIYEESVSEQKSNGFHLIFKHSFCYYRMCKVSSWPNLRRRQLQRRSVMIMYNNNVML